MIPDPIKQHELNNAGLATLKCEGAPIHPIEMNCDLTQAQYERQLIAYHQHYHPELFAGNQ